MSNLTPVEKLALISKQQLANYSAKSKWYIYRNRVLQKVEDINNTNNIWWFKQILIVLLKIYWELKKPK